uniref:Uncharacterized protein n=1 Tax=Arundo donax TaxID=35708 RepID=A0A0A9DB72_ARUDO
MSNTECWKLIYRFSQVSQAPVKLKLNFIGNEEMIKAASIRCSNHQSSPVRETLEEEAVCDLRRCSDKNPTNEMDNKRGLRGFGSQHPSSINFGPISGGTPALPGLLRRLRDHPLDLGVELYRPVGRRRRAGLLSVLGRAARDGAPPPPPLPPTPT